MKLIIEEWWEKVVDDPRGNRLGRRVLKGEYERHSRVVYRNETRTPAEFRKQMKRKSLISFVDGRAKFDRGNGYGIHSYQLVYQEEGG